MSATGGQCRSKDWKKNVIQKQMVNGYITEQKLLHRLIRLFPYVNSTDEFGLDTSPAHGWVFYAPCEVQESEYHKLASKKPTN